MMNFPFKRLYQKYMNRSMRTKLMLSFSALIFISIMTVLVVVYSYVSRDYKQQIQYSADKSFSQAYDFIDKKIESLLYTADVVYSNEAVQSILSKDLYSYRYDYQQQHLDMLALEKLLNSLSYSKDAYLASLYVDDSLMYSRQNLFFFSNQLLEQNEEYKKWFNSNEMRIWLPPEKIRLPDQQSPVILISLLRKINSIYGGNNTIGVERISMKADGINEIIQKANITQNGVVYIQNSNNQMINTLRENAFEKLDLARDQLPDREMKWEKLTRNGKSFLVNSRRFHDSDWTMIAIIPFSEILSLSNRLGVIIMLLLLVSIAVTCSVAYLFARSMTKGLSILSRQMESVQNGILDNTITTKKRDEIGKLINSFNYLVNRIKQHSKEQYESGKAIKTAELKALQAQINPHFLYNTLDLINWRALNYNAPQIAEISTALAKFYKISLNKGRDILSIGEEAAHVSAYVKIQNFKYDGAINLTIQIPDEIKSYSIIKTVLQPIVENSIMHGIMLNRDGRPKEIEISAVRQAEDIVIYVRDNGVGMSREQLAVILEEKSGTSISGYGVWNIHSRLQLCYGPDYGLHYESAPGEGTTAAVKIPAAPL